MRGCYERRLKGRTKRRRPWQSSILPASFLPLCLYNADVTQRQNWREKNNIYWLSVFIRTQRRAHIQWCRKIERVKNWFKKGGGGLFSGRVAAIASSTNGLWRLCGRLKHYNSHSITFSSCCLLFRTKKCLMIRSIVTQTIRDNDVRAYSILHGGVAEVGWRGPVGCCHSLKVSNYEKRGRKRKKGS